MKVPADASIDQYVGTPRAAGHGTVGGGCEHRVPRPPRDAHFCHTSWLAQSVACAQIRGYRLVGSPVALLVTSDDLVASNDLVNSDDLVASDVLVASNDLVNSDDLVTSDDLVNSDDLVAFSFIDVCSLFEMILNY